MMEPTLDRSAEKPTKILIPTGGDNGSLAAVVEAHRDCGGRPPATVYADAGYINAPELARPSARGPA